MRRSISASTCGPGACEAADADVVIVGLGGIGSAAAYRLAQRGRRVVGIERYELGHARAHRTAARGSCGTRTTRPRTSRLAGLAFDGVARRRGGRLAHRCSYRRAASTCFPHGAAISADDYVSAMTANGVAFEILDATDVRKRWPQWRLAPDTLALFQPDAGDGVGDRCHERASTARARARSDAAGARRRDRLCAMSTGRSRSCSTGATS